MAPWPDGAIVRPVREAASPRAIDHHGLEGPGESATPKSRRHPSSSFFFRAEHTGLSRTYPADPPGAPNRTSREEVSSRLMSRDWDDLRKDFPGIKDRVYFNAAAASISPKWVREAVARYLQEYEEGGDDHWDLWLAQMEVVRERVARYIGAQADEIAFVTNTSEGMNILADLVSGDGPVLSDELEFPTVTLPFIHRGVQMQFIPAIEGELRMEMFDETHAPRATTISVSHVQFSNGFRIDIEALGALKGRRNLLVCGSQSVGAFEVDVRAMQIDGLACAGHKWMMAGYGAGFLYISKELLKRPPHQLGWRSVKDPFSF